VAKWLTKQQQEYWRSFLSVMQLLPDVFSHDLKEHGLSLSDYEILVRLSEADSRSIRMSDLARLTLATRSRLTHQVDRLEEQGLVSRYTCTQDKRGLWAQLTDKGYALLVALAPIHVQSVRRNLVDVLSERELELLGAISEKILGALPEDLQAKSLSISKDAKQDR
jgi:DNA-binding MarR family transcriptional regulator